MISVIISTRNDAVGTMITVRSVLEEAKIVNVPIEIILIDNSESIPQQNILNQLIDKEYKTTNVKLFKHKIQCIFTAREYGIRRAKHNIILVLDSHMIMGYKSLLAFVRFFKNAPDNLGIAYGPVNYSRAEEDLKFCDRSLDNFLGLRYSNKYKNDTKINFRGVPFAFKKSIFKKIGGYGCLAEHKLPWGGGDTHVGIKALLFGYNNWLVSKGLCIHIGPFNYNSRYFIPTYMHENNNDGNFRIGMLVSAYVLGGKDLMEKRFEQLQQRIKSGWSKSILTKAAQMGEMERRRVNNEAKYSYSDLLENANEL